MKKFILFISILTFSSSVISQKNAGLTEFFTKEIDEKFHQILENFAIPGAAVALIENGEIIFQKTYGYADKAKGIPITEHTGFNVGSISKVLTAWGILKLVERGKIHLDDPAEKHLNGWQFPKSSFSSEGVTIRRLLSHSAGLSIHSVSAGPPYDDLPTLEEWLDGNNDGLGKLEIILKPGTKPRYSGGGFAICQLIIENVSGQKFQEFMQNEILDPLGMTGSSFKIDKKIMSSSARPYDSFGESTDFELFTVQAGAGLHTTLDDITQFMLASMPGIHKGPMFGDVLKEETKIEMTRNQSKQIGSWAYGLGYQTFRSKTGKKFIGHGGANAGWQANFWIEPNSQDGVVILTNSGAGNNICNFLFCNWITWKTGEAPWRPCEPQPSIAIKIKEYIDKEGTGELAKGYQKLKDEYREDLDFSESQLNNLGYYYLGRNLFAKAKSVFKLNLDLFPNSYNVYDSYGEALLAQGNKKEAIANYIHSIRLNPGNSHGLRILNMQGVSNEDIINKIELVPLNEGALSKLIGQYQSASGEVLRINQRVNTLSVNHQDDELLLIPKSPTRFLKLGSDDKVSFFKTIDGIDGLWTKQTIWIKQDDEKTKEERTTKKNIELLLLRDNPSWNRPTDFEDVLSIMGYQFDQSQSIDLPEINLKKYNMIVIPGGQQNDFYKNYVEHSQRFEQFVAEGGKLIFELNGAEEVLNELPNGVRIIPSKAIENRIIDSDHPITLPISDSPTIRARYASMSYFQNIPDGTKTLAIEAEDDSTFEDRPTFIEYKYGKGSVLAASQCFHDRDGSGRGPMMQSLISYIIAKN